MWRIKSEIPKNKNLDVQEIIRRRKETGDMNR